MPGTPGVPAAPLPGAARPEDRRILRAVGRWAAALAVFGVLGGGIAYGLTQPERTDLPGLATEGDGRWDYPELTLPALPSGSPRPFAKGNVGEIHHADIRDLLLPVPEGAKADEELPKIDGGWVPVKEFVKLYDEDERDFLSQRLADDAVRHIAARGWTMPDGTRTSVYLLRFNTTAYAGEFHSDMVAAGLSPFLPLTGAPEATLDESWPEEATVENVERSVYDEPEPRGEEHVRQAYLVAGDTLALVIQSRKGSAPKVPFQQTVILQSQLLG